jgi:hypothetical protein
MRSKRSRLGVAVAVVVAVLIPTGVGAASFGGSQAWATAVAARPSASGCQLGNGVRHVINLTSTTSTSSATTRTYRPTSSRCRTC